MAIDYGKKNAPFEWMGHLKNLIAGVSDENQTNLPHFIVY
jgi:hypothetical protein